MKLLFVCTANVCRSPLAEGYFKSLAAENPEKFDVTSAGIAALSNTPAFDCAIEVASLNGFDLSSHRSKRLTLPLAKETDLILCMESWQASSIMDMDPELLGKITLLGKYHPGKTPLFQIPDPREFNVKYTQDVFSLIRISVDSLYRTL